MKIEDLKVGRVYRAKRPRVVHTLGGSYINDRQILSISPFEETIQYDSPKVGFGSKKSDIVLRIEKALKEYTPSKIDGVRIATARGILTAYEIAVKNGLSEAGKVDCIKVCESFMLPPITYGITNPEEHYITCEKKNYKGDVIKTFKAFDLPTELITLCFEIKSTVSDFKSPNGHNLVGDVNYYVMPSDTFKQLEKLGLLDEVPPHIGFITAHEGRYSKLRLITKKAATKVTPTVDKYMLAWSAVKGRYINSSVSNKKVNSAAIVECKGFKVRERQI